MNHLQTALGILAVFSVSTVLGSRYRRAPQYIPLYTVNNDLHNSITGLTYELHNRIASAVNFAAANAIGNSAYAYAPNYGMSYGYPVNGNTFVQTFGAPGQQGIFVSTFSGGSGGTVRPTSFRPTPFRQTTTSLRPTSSSTRPVSSIRPVTSSFRPTTTPVRPLSSPGRPVAVASVGLRPGGGVSASAAAVSTSG